jgi:hypothetical protein
MTSALAAQEWPPQRIHHEFAPAERSQIYDVIMDSVVAIVDHTWRGIEGGASQTTIVLDPNVRPIPWRDPTALHQSEWLKRQLAKPFVIGLCEPLVRKWACQQGSATMALSLSSLYRGSADTVLVLLSMRRWPGGPPERRGGFAAEWMLSLKRSGDGWALVRRQLGAITQQEPAWTSGSTTHRAAARESDDSVCATSATSAGVARAQEPRSVSSALAGTYTFTLCHPSCDDSSAVVGRGILVIVEDSIILPFEPAVVQRIYDRSAFIRLRVERRPPARPDGQPLNACFRVTAQRRIGDREYYPGAIPEALTALVPGEGRSFTVILYGSADASFHVTIDFDSASRFSGIGIQHDWDRRGPPEFGTIAGHRVGPPDPARCFPSLQ